MQASRLLRPRPLFRMWVCLCFSGIVAHAVPVREYDLKATFVLNFTRFVDWPETAEREVGQPFTIGVIGDDPFDGALEAVVRGIEVNNRPLAVRKLRRGEDAGGCQVVFICRSESAHLPEIIEPLRGKPVLTVSDIDHFAYRGGIIGLVMEQEKIRFEINVEKARAAQLVMSAKLLRSAILVREKPVSSVGPNAGRVLVRAPLPLMLTY